MRTDRVSAWLIYVWTSDTRRVLPPTHDLQHVECMHVCPNSIVLTRQI